MLVKYYLIDTRNRETGTYTLSLHEVYVDSEEDDLLKLGKLLHDTEFGSRDRRWFVRVMGIDTERTL